MKFLRRRDLLLGGAAAVAGSQINFHDKSVAKPIDFQPTEPLIAVISAYSPETTED